MQFSVNRQTFSAPVYTPEAMAEAIHAKTGKPITPALVTSLQQALKKVGNPELHRDTLSLDIEGFDTILGKVDGHKHELVEAQPKRNGRYAPNTAASCSISPRARTKLHSSCTPPSTKVQTASTSPISLSSLPRP